MRRRHWGIICGIILLVSLFLIFFSKNNDRERDILSLNLREHKNIALHIHPQVEIYILGVKKIIPNGVGISANGMRVIHTHDDTGKLHIESPTPHQFYLKDFFTIWGKNFNSTCILEYCADEKHKMKVLVNGIENYQYGDIALQEHDIIKIYYE